MGILFALYLKWSPSLSIYHSSSPLPPLQSLTLILFSSFSSSYSTNFDFVIAYNLLQKYKVANLKFYILYLYVLDIFHFFPPNKKWMSFQEHILFPFLFSFLNTSSEEEKNVWARDNNDTNFNRAITVNVECESRTERFQVSSKPFWYYAHFTLSLSRPLSMKQTLCRILNEIQCNCGNCDILLTSLMLFSLSLSKQHMVSKKHTQGVDNAHVPITCDTLTKH